MVPRTIGVLALMAVLFAAGCNKKKSPATDNNAPGQGDANKQSGREGENRRSGWLGGSGDDDRPKNDRNANASRSGSPSESGNPGIIPSGAGGGVVTNPGAVTGGGGGGGAAQAVRKAAKRPAEMNDLKQIQIYIEYASGASGKMPSPQETYAAIKKEAPMIAEKIEEGTIVLHPATSREDIWAYEAKALESRGWVVTNQGVEQMDAQTLKARLGRK